MNNLQCPHCGIDGIYWRPECPHCKGTGIVKVEGLNNTQLPAEVVEEIKVKAESIYPLIMAHTHTDGPRSGFIKGATEYATKMQQAQQEIESLTNQLKNHGKVAGEDKDLLIEMYNVKHNTARTLLQKFISRHEAGLLPDMFIYNEIKTFLDGKK